MQGQQGVNLQILTGVLLDDAALTLEELARACAVEPDWVVRHVHEGVLGGGLDVSVQVTSWRFRSGDLVRARRLLSIERDFDANDDLAALVVDLADEIRRLRGRLRVLGINLA
jgi:chaperone modulatory protein CbpM